MTGCVAALKGSGEQSFFYYVSSYYSYRGVVKTAVTFFNYGRWEGFWFGHEMLQTRGEFCLFSEAHLALFRHALLNHITCSTCASINTWHHQGSPCTCLCLRLQPKLKLKHGHRACLEVQGLSYASSTLGAGEHVCCWSHDFSNCAFWAWPLPPTNPNLAPPNVFLLSIPLPPAKEKAALS